jgi:MFS family permease
MGFKGWQWMFMIEGVPAILLAFVVWKKLPDGPESAPWLTPAQVQEVRRRLGTETGSHAVASGTAFLGALRERQVWLAIFIYFCHQIAIYTVIFFLPGIIGTYGKLTPLQIGMLNSLPWIAAAVGAAWLPKYASTARRGRQLLLIGLVVMAAGMLLAASSGPVLGLVGFSLTALMFFVVQSIVFVFPSSRLKGAALAGGLAIINTCGLVGGFIGPSVMGVIEQTTGSTRYGLVVIAVLLLVAAIGAPFMRQGHE